ncbi:hypothetical protein VKT23_012463 [Stygiomarasmius scandens]|uniref:IRG-type G domain-containing protein n=1 Tax=Marasmiellus scandens TaxID=2682957 RepID=A0ABR1JAS9_9AGAR
MGGCASKNNPTMDEIKSYINQELRERIEQERKTRQSQQSMGTGARPFQMQMVSTTKNLKPDRGQFGKRTVNPVKWPTEEEYLRAREEREYEDGFVHLAIAGASGSGKSSLINAFRGVPNGSAERHAAATGVIETTSVTGKYPDPRYPEYPFIWYDIPGAGTLKVKDWEYFNQQGLFVYDIIIVVWHSRFTEIDISILRNCARFKIPTFIVRSHSDTHLRDMQRDRTIAIEDDPRLSDEEKDFQLEKLPGLVLDEYITQTRQNVEENLNKAGLPLQEVYLVSYEGVLYTMMDRRVPKDVRLIDEQSLLDDIIKVLMQRRLTGVYPAYVDAKNVLKEVKKNFSRLGTLLPKRN